uniref:Uncharacterized protein n=1 Tax=Brassica oleracea var. oleracea TaxID=109376 RepID=A0A0D3BG41_BRAOL
MSVTTRARSLRSDRTLVRARSLRIDRAEWAFGCYVVTELWLELDRAEHAFGRSVTILLELLSDDSCFFRKGFSELNHRVGQLAGELNRRVVVFAAEFGRHASWLARRARPDPGLSDLFRLRIFRIAVISDLRDHILLVSF